MSRLIDADALLEEIKTFDEKYELQKTDVYDLITNAPTVQREGWVSVDDRLPDVPKGELRHFNIAILREYDGKTYVIPAVYLNAMELTNAHSYDDEIYTGWHEAKEHYEFEEYYSKIECPDGDKVTHWQPLPAAPTDKE